MHTRRRSRLEGVQEKLNPHPLYDLGSAVQPDYKLARSPPRRHHDCNRLWHDTEEELGLVILPHERNAAADGADVQVFDSLFISGTPRDGRPALEGVQGEQGHRRRAGEKKYPTAPGTSPSLELKRSAAQTRDVGASGRGRDVTTGAMPPPLPASGAWPTNLRITWRDRRSAIADHLTLDPRAKTDEIRVETLGNFKRPRERRRRGAEAREEEVKNYLGAYEVKAPPLEISIEMIGGKLKGVIPGQPVATLVPVAADRFKVVVEGATAEIFVQFDMDSNKPKSMTLEQGGARFTLLPKGK